jgi:hypothetical protein
MKVTILLELEIGGEGEEKGYFNYRPTEVWHNGKEIKGETQLRTMQLPTVIFDDPKKPPISLTVVIMED